MPTYDYVCENCNYSFEQFQTITARLLRKCPQCGKMKLKRLIGIGTGVIFKGTGFYETDYRSENYKKAQQKEKDSTKTTKKDKVGTDAAPSTSGSDRKIKETTKNKTTD